jgi:hypothetical protein
MEGSRTLWTKISRANCGAFLSDGFTRRQIEEDDPYFKCIIHHFLSLGIYFNAPKMGLVLINSSKK